jgi:hypothetical protein
VSNSPAERQRRAPFRERHTAGWIVIALMLAGLAQALYGIWSARSAAAAAPIFHSSVSCRLPTFDSTRNATPGPCRLESATVIMADYSSNRSGTHYYLVTVSSAGARDYTTLATKQGIAFWRRLQPTQRVVLQRFVAPGYYLTGKVTAFADTTGAAMTRYHPDSGTHYEGTNALMGSLLFAATFALYFFGFRRSRWRVARARAAGPESRREWRIR